MKALMYGLISAGVWISAAGLSSASGGVTPDGLPENVLLNFSASWCGPCRQMKPTVTRLIHEGLPVRHIDVDRHPGLARKYRVSGIPAFVLIVNGREVDRKVGYTPASQLRRMLARIPQQRQTDNEKKTPNPNNGNDMLAAGPPTPDIPRRPADGADSAGRDDNRDGRRFQLPLVDNRDDTHRKSKSADSDETPNDNPVIRANLDAAPRRLTADADERLKDGRKKRRNAASQRRSSTPMAASVRIRIRDGGGSNYGTGTIIHSRAGRSLVLTCGHIFRNISRGSVVEVDLFDGQNVRTFTGNVLRYNLKADVGLLTLSNEQPLPFVPIAETDNAPQVGDPVFSVGCGGGRPPSRMSIRVTALNRYLGPDNIEGTGVPKQGRSGGGLFNRNGRLVGVCFAADPPRGRGLYAGLRPVYHLLKEAGIDASAVRGSRRDNGSQPNSDSRFAGRDDIPIPPLSPSRRNSSQGRNGNVVVEIDQQQLSAMQVSAREQDAMSDETADRGSHSNRSTDNESTNHETTVTVNSADNRNSRHRRQGGEPSALTNVDRIFQHGGDAEVVCIIRPLDNPRAESRVVVIHRASSKFVNYLQNELHNQPRTTARYVSENDSTSHRPQFRDSAERPFNTESPVASVATGDELVTPFRQVFPADGERSSVSSNVRRSSAAKPSRYVRSPETRR